MALARELTRLRVEPVPYLNLFVGGCGNGARRQAPLVAQRIAAAGSKLVVWNFDQLMRFVDELNS
jgi:hypothetical protein